MFISIRLLFNLLLFGIMANAHSLLIEQRVGPAARGPNMGSVQLTLFTDNGSQLHGHSKGLGRVRYFSNGAFGVHRANRRFYLLYSGLIWDMNCDENSRGDFTSWTCSTTGQTRANDPWLQEEADGPIECTIV